MKRLIALLICCVMLLPAAALAKQADETVTITYNGQSHEYTYLSLPKCCSEADTSHDINFSPVDPDNEVGTLSISFPTVAKTGDRYVVRRGEEIQWITFYTSGPSGIRNYVSGPGSLLGTRLISEDDYYEMTVNELVEAYGAVYLDASIKGVFMEGTEEFEMHFKVKFLLT